MSFIVWLTGLSGSGKTTISDALIDQLGEGMKIDGDWLRQGLCKDLGFSPEDRKENIRRAGALAIMTAAQGTPAVVSLISPYHADRLGVRTFAETMKIPFYEIHVAAPLEVCEQRDPKGLYKRARRGEIPNFTGVHESAPYEPPGHEALHIDTVNSTPDQCAAAIRALAWRSDVREEHLFFIGRWTPFHMGHLALIKTGLEGDNAGKPVHVGVRATPDDAWPPSFRKAMVEHALRTAEIEHTVQIIPNTETMFYGRGVGWTPEEIVMPAGIQGISATKIREMRKTGNPEWEALVAPGVADFLKEYDHVG